MGIRQASLLVLVGDARDQTQDLLHAKQMLYLWQQTPSDLPWGVKFHPVQSTKLGTPCFSHFIPNKSYGALSSAPKAVHQIGCTPLNLSLQIPNSLVCGWQKLPSFPPFKK